MSLDSDRKSRDAAVEEPTSRRDAADEDPRPDEGNVNRPADAEAGRELPRGTDETPER